METHAEDFQYIALLREIFIVIMTFLIISVLTMDLKNSVRNRNLDVGVCRFADERSKMFPGDTSDDELRSGH